MEEDGNGVGDGGIKTRRAHVNEPRHPKLIASRDATINFFDVAGRIRVPYTITRYTGTRTHTYYVHYTKNKERDTHG